MRTGQLRVSSVNALQKPSARNEESVVESREVYIKHLLDTGAVKDWNNEDAIKTGARILSGRIVDDAHSERSRWCAREFATCKDPSVFAAVSNIDNASLIDLLAVKRGHSVMCFDAVAAFGQALQTELIFVEGLAVHRATVGQQKQCRWLEVTEGRRKGARAWQDHFVDILLSRKCLGTFKQILKSLAISYSSEFEIALDLHVDDGNVTGLAENMKKVFACLETNIVL